MTRAFVRSATVLFVAATCARLAWFSVKEGMHYPDEIFQYLEPVAWRITGDAFLPWEFEVGARHWVLPAFWAPWIEIGRAIGLRRWELHRFLAVHACVLGSGVVFAARRMVVASTRDERAGWMAAWMTALFPLLGYFAPHTLSELPAMVLVAFSHALWLEARGSGAPAARRAFISGALLAAATACRVPSLLSALVIGGDLLVRRRAAILRAHLLGFAVCSAAFGLVDAVTWGSPWHSAFAFVRANVLYERQLAFAGLSEPWHFYLSASRRCMGLAAPVLAALSLFSCRRHARLFFAWTVPLAGLSILANKQDRFLLPLIPVFLASAACGIAEVLRFLPSRLSRGAAVGATVGVCLAALPAASRLPLRPWGGVFRAQAWIGSQTGASGVLIDGGENANGGYLLLDRTIPLVPYTPELARHPLFDHVIAFKPALLERMQSDPSFEPIADFDGARVFRRRQP